MKILITGASGFVGSHIVDRALQLGYETWASIRPTSDLTYLTDERIHLIELDYTHATLLYDQLQFHRDTHGAWDVVVHCAGITKSLRSSDFYTINYDGTRHLADTLIALHMQPRQFIFISTLGVYGPLHETTPFRPTVESDIPRPNTHYGRSKRLAEEYLMKLSGFPYVIFRPTGVYGPRDKDYTILIHALRNHLELTLGYRHQELTFIYIHDLVKAIFLSISHNISRRSYFITDNNIYTSHDFADIVRQALDNPFVLRITIPLWIGYLAAHLCDAIGHLTQQSFTFNTDKFRLLKQRNWTCDITPIIQELGYRPEYNLQRGIHEIIPCRKDS